MLTVSLLCYVVGLHLTFLQLCALMALATKALRRSAKKGPETHVPVYGEPSLYLQKGGGCSKRHSDRVAISISESSTVQESSASAPSRYTKKAAAQPF
jgi:hypothetical protein